MDSNNALWKGLMLYWLNVKLNFTQGLPMFTQKQILRLLDIRIYKTKLMKIFLKNIAQFVEWNVMQTMKCD